MKRASTVWVVISLLAHLSLADHLPRRLQATGKPEKTLAGIYLNRTRFSDIVKLNGKPDKVEGEDHIWSRHGVKLRLVIARGNGVVNGEYIELIEVEGEKSAGIISQTGAGLKIGDSRNDVIRIYGQRFGEYKLPQEPFHTILIQWRGDEVSLDITFDKAGRVKKLTLLGPE